MNSTLKKSKRLGILELLAGCFIFAFGILAAIKYGLITLGIVFELMSLILIITGITRMCVTDNILCVSSFESTHHRKLITLKFKEFKKFYNINPSVYYIDNKSYIQYHWSAFYSNVTDEKIAELREKRIKIDNQTINEDGTKDIWVQNYATYYIRFPNMIDYARYWLWLRTKSDAKDEDDALAEYLDTVKEDIDIKRKSALNEINKASKIIDEIIGEDYITKQQDPDDTELLWGQPIQ